MMMRLVLALLSMTLMPVSMRYPLIDAAEPALVYSRSAAMREYVRPSEIPYPAGNEPTAERELLGRTLFFDPRLSKLGSTSCASCHNPALSWGDGLPKAIGQAMKPLGRRTPTVLNLAWAELLFWDGRADSLEVQALGPIQAVDEMAMPLDRLLRNLQSMPGYRQLFAVAYPGEGLTVSTVGKALAQFERTLVSSQAPFDHWIAGDEAAISAEAKAGFDLFNGKAKCSTCHSGWNFSDQGFHDVGIADDDLGRGKFLKLEAMQHAFKTPTLRNIGHRGPFMHDGSEQTLEDVVNFYDCGGKARRPSIAPEIVKLNLTDAEKAALVAFLATLTSIDKPVTIPVLPR